MKIRSLIFFVFFLAPHAAFPEDLIQIGAVFGLSGDVALYGRWASNGATIAADKFNEENSSHGRQAVILTEDGRGKPADSVTAFHALRNNHNIQFVLTHSSSVALALAPLANAEHVVQMDVSASTPAYSSPDDFTFRTGIVATQLAGDMADFLEKRFGVRRIAVLYIENEKGLSGYEGFRRRYRGEILMAESFRESEVDYRSLLLKLHSKQIPDVWISGHLKETGLLLKRAAESGLRERYFSDVYSVEGADFLQTAGAAAEGIVYISPKFDPASAEPTVSDFVSRYQKKFGESPNYFAAQSFDGVMAILEAAKSCQESKAACVKAALYKLNRAGASGSIRFDRNGDVVKSTELKIVRGGKFLPLP